MTTPADLTGSAEPLRFRNRPIRHTMIDGVPWFYLADLCTALNRSSATARLAETRQFPDFARQSHVDETDGETLVLSAVGVWYLTELDDRLAGQALAAWARREARQLCPSPAPNDPNMFLTILPDRCLPPLPAKYTGWFNEWDDLRFTREGMDTIGRWPYYYAPVYASVREAENRIMERLG